jgi:hypothetical protein
MRVELGARGDEVMHRVVVASYFASLVAFAASLVLTFEGKLWVGPLGDVSSISVGSVSVIYALGQYRFKSVGYTEMKSFVLGVLFANAFLQCYELAYGLTWALSAVVNDPVTLTGTDVRTFLLWAIMISPILLVHEHLRFKRTGAVLLVLTAAVWTAWILYGFPQYYLSGYFFPRYLDTTDPYHLSLWLNFGSKALLAVFFVSLLEPLKAFKAALDRL